MNCCATYIFDSHVLIFFDIDVLCALSFQFPQLMKYDNTIRCSVCPLVFSCCELSHVIFLKLRKKTAWKAKQIHKMTTIFTQIHRS